MKKSIYIWIAALLAGFSFDVFSQPALPWLETDFINSSSAGTNDFFGGAVSADGNYAVIGSPWDGQNATPSGGVPVNQAGSAYIYEKDSATGNWTEKQKLLSAFRSQFRRFGGAVCMHNGFAFIGQTGNTSNDRVEIFKRDSIGVWQPYQVIRAAVFAGNADNKFGYSLAASGNNLIVGASGAQPEGGAAYFFEDSAGVWLERQRVAVAGLNPNNFSSPRFGFDVDIDNNRAVVGTPGEDRPTSNSSDDKGAAYVYEKNSIGTWVMVRKLVASDAQTDDEFGYSVAIEGNYVAVGAPYEDHDATGGNFKNESGSVYVFNRNSSGTWSQQVKLTMPDATRDGRQELGYQPGHEQ